MDSESPSRRPWRGEWCHGRAHDLDVLVKGVLDGDICLNPTRNRMREEDVGDPERGKPQLVLIVFELCAAGTRLDSRRGAAGSVRELERYLVPRNLRNGEADELRGAGRGEHSRIGK